MTTAVIENVQTQVTEIREQEEKFHKEMGDACMLFADKFSKGEVENALEYPDDIHAVCPLQIIKFAIMYIDSYFATKERWQTHSVAVTMSR